MRFIEMTLAFVAERCFISPFLNQKYASTRHIYNSDYTYFQLRFVEYTFMYVRSHTHIHKYNHRIAKTTTMPAVHFHILHRIVNKNWIFVIENCIVFKKLYEQTASRRF